MILPSVLSSRLLKALPVVCATALLAAQTPDEGHPRSEAPSTESSPSTEAKSSVQDLVRGLGSESFRDRSRSERELKAMGKEALPELKKAAASDSDPEIQWRARRLVRQLEQQESGGLEPRDDGSIDPQKGGGTTGYPGGPLVRRFRFGLPGGQRGIPLDVQDRFDELFRSLEQDFGVDVPRARFFDDTFFRDLQQQMEDAQKAFSGGAGQGRSMSMHTGPAGVKVEIRTKNETGEEETKTYEAPDLETFQQKYPGVLDGGGFGGRFSFSFPDGGLRTFGAPGSGMRVLGPRSRTGQGGRVEPRAGDPGQVVEVVPPADRRLGIVVKPEVAPELLEHLSLDGALLVEEVQAGTLAESLGIQKGDLVTNVGGRSIATTADVADALARVAPGEDVEVVVVRKGKSLSLVGAKPRVEGESPAPLERRNRRKDESEGGR